MQDVQHPQADKAHALSGFSVLVTRPRDQAHALCELIEASGGHALRFPVIEILPAHNISESQQLIQRICDFDLAIFISANAVHFAMQQFPKPGQLPPALTISAIGKATAAALSQYGVNIDISPDTDFNSESLLSMPQMQDLAGKKIILFKGEGGRELLAETLVQRGAKVSLAIVYRRALPDVEIDDLIQAWSKGEVNAVTVTSQEGLYNLSSMLGVTGRKLLQQTPLVVISERMLEVTRELGIESPVIIAKHASDNAIVDALIVLSKKQK